MISYQVIHSFIRTKCSIQKLLSKLSILIDNLAFVQVSLIYELIKIFYHILADSPDNRLKRQSLTK